jgi:cytochrome c biogenesis protein CcmG/thiol:disulfide interchange protein DsbE
VADECFVFGNQSLQMGLFVASKIHENLSPAGILNLLREICEEAMRASFQIHGDVQRLEIGRFIGDFDSEQLLLGKDIFRDFAAERQPRRFALQPLVAFDQRTVFRLQPAQVVGFLGSQALKHEASPVIFRLARGVGVKGVAAALDGKREFEGIANKGGFQAAAFADARGFPFLANAGLAKAENCVSAISLLETVFMGNLAKQVFDFLRRKLHIAAAAIAYEMQMVGLADYSFITCDAFQLRLSNEPGSQKNFDGSIDRRQPDAVALCQQHLANFFRRRVAFSIKQHTPNQSPLRGLSEMLLLEQLLEFFTFFHWRPIIREEAQFEESRLLSYSLWLRIMKGYHMKRIVLVMVFSLAVFGCSSRNAPGGAASPDSTIDQPAPEFELTKISGGSLKSADMKGKVTVVDFWATWCEPCKVEIPNYNALREKYGDKGVEFLGITVESGGIEEIKAAVEELHMNYPVVLGDDKVVEGFGGLIGFPTTFIVSKDWKIHKKYLGMTFNKKDQLEKDINALLEQDPTVAQLQRDADGKQ